RRYHESIKSDAEDASFDVDVFVSGYACRLSGIGFTTRSGKAFLRLAKGFAALPKLPGGAGSGRDPVPPLSRSTEDLLASAHLPPLPTRLRRSPRWKHLKAGFAVWTPKPPARSRVRVAIHHLELPPSGLAVHQFYSAAMNNGPNTNGSESSFSSDLNRWHANLEERLHPFWSSALSGRTIRVSLYASDPTLYDSDGEYTNESGSSDGPPEKRQYCLGTWEPLRMARSMLSSQSHGRACVSILAPCTLHSAILALIKLSNILSGARAVFRNVFVNDLRDSVIPGMGEWYTDMWRSGIRFHYVSNGPFELLPVVNQFFQVSQLPPGSVRLRSYGGRSLFNGLLSAPAMRKRAGVLDVLNHFPDAKFVLVGDSGEQDLELYAGSRRSARSRFLLCSCEMRVRTTDWGYVFRAIEPVETKHVGPLSSFAIHLNVGGLVYVKGEADEDLFWDEPPLATSRLVEWLLHLVGSHFPLHIRRTSRDSGMLALPGLTKEPESYLPPPIKTQQSWSEPRRDAMTCRCVCGELVRRSQNTYLFEYSESPRSVWK
ncbi:Phosphatidate phosphatase APP1, partial [Grifola frondosa]